ncbi:MAG: TFIIB-type zinc ribbon-containing protein [Planctomycetota bacterium]|jgi:DNA-directed RNA polymerase subunit RPC12/RpoP
MKQEQFDCPGCGAQFEFDPEGASLKCPYCGFEKNIPRSEEDILELDFHSFLGEAEREEDTQETLTVKCPACSAESSFEANVTSDECPFCGTNIVVSSSSKKALRPKSLLPFKITRDDGNRLFRDWIKGLWFAPNRLKREAYKESRLQGLYIPYWTYDTDATSFYRGERGEDYWETERYTAFENGKHVTKTRRVRKTRWYPASGWVYNRFNDILILASRSLPRKYTERLEPWDLENLAPYKDEFLSGFRAESYQVSLAEGFEEAQDVMDPVIRSSVRSDIGGDHQRIHSIRTSYEDITFKHILLPIWISAYLFNQKTYRFLINARTGEVQGERPWSWVKILLLVLFILAVLGGAVLLFTQSV